MNIENKKTALSDDASLYKHETDHMTEKEKLGRMNGEQKWQHFKQYYLWKVVGALVIVGIITSILWAVIRPKKQTVFYACVFDGCVGRDIIYTLRDDFEKSLAIDTSKYKTTFDQDFLYTGPYSESIQRFVTLIRAGSVNATFMPEPIFKLFAGSGYFLPMEQVLSEEEMEIFHDKLAFASTLDEDGNEIEGTLMPYGLKVSECSALSDNVCQYEVILAFSVNQKDLTNSRDFIKFLFANE